VDEFDKFIVAADLMNSRLDKIKKNVKHCFWALTKHINEIFFFLPPFVFWYSLMVDVKVVKNG
jgi:hypothetical protein